jgi:hypothetical protein
LAGSAAAAEGALQSGAAAPAAEARAEAAPDLAADIAPDQIYGPDDPAYGPPGPGWYKQREERMQREERAQREERTQREERPPPADDGPVPDAAEAAAARGPFEPLRSDNQAADHQAADHPATDLPDHGPADGEPGLNGYGSSQPGTSAYEEAEYDRPEPLDFGEPTDPAAGTLGDIRDLYLTAEKIDPARLDRHFDQLLERQRKLIGEYFEESGATGPAETPDSDASLGFDTAESLAALRGDLRSAP